MVTLNVILNIDLRPLRSRGMMALETEIWLYCQPSQLEVEERECTRGRQALYIICQAKKFKVDWAQLFFQVPSSQPLPRWTWIFAVGAPWAGNIEAQYREEFNEIRIRNMQELD